MRKRIVIGLALLLALCGPGRAAQPAGAEADALMRAGRYEEASEAYRRAVLARPDDAALRLRFALALAATGRYEYAAYALRRAVRELGYPEGLWVDVASAFADPGAYERMRSAIHNHLLRFPGEPNALTVEAFVRFMAGELPEAHALCEQLARAQPNDPFAAWLVARIESLARPPAQLAGRGTQPPAPARPGAHAAPPGTAGGREQPARQAVAAPAPPRAAADNPQPAPQPSSPAAVAPAGHDAAAARPARPESRPAARAGATASGAARDGEDAAAEALRRRGRRADLLPPLPPPALEPVIVD